MQLESCLGISEIRIRSFRYFWKSRLRRCQSTAPLSCAKRIMGKGVSTEGSLLLVRIDYDIYGIVIFVRRFV
jgi:hypothetical protein